MPIPHSGSPGCPRAQLTAEREREVSAEDEHGHHGTHPTV
ncbi:hypothetical protein Cadr_000015366 [Camelus dromedarius]|uniref:Uncharacterized protein n=1 Tax=Camelus dromedarius TaxID=9838 RepID=A0A5N4DL59_CAMDR|nr:hypothetical protein Cadr_000015366 [Camelus dromedarius]